MRRVVLSPWPSPALGRGNALKRRECQSSAAFEFGPSFTPIESSLTKREALFRGRERVWVRVRGRLRKPRCSVLLGRAPHRPERYARTQRLDRRGAEQAPALLRRL